MAVDTEPPAVTLQQINAAFTGLSYDEQRERLRWDTPALAANAFEIVNKRGKREKLLAKPEQLRFDQGLEAQREADLPMRAVILKARQLGFSTWTQAKLIQRTTQNSDHPALVLAQVNDTAGHLFNMGKRMWESLPDEADLKPKLVGRRKEKRLEFSNGSYYRADNAKEFEASRGLTLMSVHCSEVASYEDAERKLSGLLEAVPDEPGTLIVLESTAKGQNYFKDLWDSAETGESGYLPFFSPWFEEPTYRLRFANLAERADFADMVGEGSIGEDEPGLIELGCDLEQLAWRRRKIRLPPFKGDIDLFHQEYPSTPDEAFLATGRHVFPPREVHRMRQRVREASEPETGRLQRKGQAKVVRSRGITIEIPQAVEWEPGSVNDDRNPGWKVWQHPVLKTDEAPAGQYVIGVDASGGDEKEGTAAYHVIDVIDHRTRVQVAEYRSKIDPDELGLEIFKACLYWNHAWAAIEVTGSWGLPAAKRLRFDYRYPFTYQRQTPGSSKERTEDRLGWHTGFESKRLLLAELREMLRNGEDGVRSRGLADEFGTYILDDRNRAKPEYGKTADRLMAHGIAVCVAREKPLRPERRRGETRSTIDGITLSRTGYRG